MATRKIKDPKTIASIVFLCLAVSAVIVLFIVGGIIFGTEHPKVLHYLNTVCTVDSSSTKVYKCKTRYSSYTCYGAIWAVHHGVNNTHYATVEESRRFRSISDAFERAAQYHVNASYSCWYDSRNPSIAQWNEPSILVGAILLGCGGLSVLIAIILFFVARKLVKQELLRNAQDGISLQNT